MGLEEKEREERYWTEFAEKGHLPGLPDALVSEKGEAYVRTVLHNEYNPLTKFLFGEVMAKRGLLGEGELAIHAEAAKWIKPMIFSKKKNYPKCREMATSFETVASKSANPKVAQMIGADIAYQKAWDWVKRAKEVYAHLVAQPIGVQLSAYIHELSNLARSSAWPKISQDSRLYTLILFWLGKILSKAKGKLSGGENSALMVLRKIDPNALPDECYVRKPREPKPEKGKDVYPATLEELAIGLYGVFKEKSGTFKTVTEQQKNWLLWAVDFLTNVYSRFEDEWGEFRIGKLLILSGDVERARTYILPTARKKPSEFWVWSLMADLFPDRRANCIARALTCPTDEKYTVRVKREAVALELPVDNKKALENLSESTEELLWVGLDPVKGVYLKSFMLERDGKRSPRVVFTGEQGVSFRPVSPVKVRFPKGKDYGTPVWLYVDPNDGQRILGVKLRDGGSAWDVLPTKNAVYLRSFKNKSGGTSHVFADGKDEFVTSLTLPQMVPGHQVVLRMVPVEGQDNKLPSFVSARVTRDTNEVPFTQLPSVVATYYGVSRSGMCQFSDGMHEYMARGDVASVTDMILGAQYLLRYTCRDVKGESIYNVWSVSACEQKSALIGSSEGVMRLGSGSLPPAFVDNIFVPPEIVRTLQDKKVDMTLPMHVVFVRISPQDKTDRFGHHYKKNRYNAISCEPLYGEELERYRCEHA